MKKMCILAAVDGRWGIGYQNNLLFHLEQDMEFFKKKTIGNVVVMGRRTLESFPGAEPLPSRKNIVLTRDEDWRRRHENQGESLVILSSVDEVLDYVEQERRDVYIIGGESVYRQFMKYATDAYVTRVNAVRTADRFFPNLDEMPEWERISVIDKIQDASGISYEIVRYAKRFAENSVG